MTCKDCIHNDVCYRKATVYLEYAEKCGDFINSLEQTQPQNCNTCKNNNKEWDEEPCDGCCGNHSGYEPQDGDLISRRALLKDMAENHIFTGFAELLQDFTDIVNEQPSVSQPQPTQICVKPTQEHIENTLDCVGDRAISLEAVHDLIATWLDDYLSEETREALETIDGKIDDMPSVSQLQEGDDLK